IVNMVWKKLHMTVNYTYIQPNYGILRRDNFTGLWAMLLNDSYDMFNGLVVPEGTEMGYFEPTYAPLEDSTYFAVPLVVEDLERLTIFHAFDKYIWFALMITLFGIGILYYVGNKLLKQDISYSKLELVFMVYQFQLENPLLKEPKSVTLKIVFIFFLGFVLIINSAYKSKLFNSSVKDNSHPMYESITDIVDKHLNVGLHIVARRIMEQSENAYARYIAKHAVECDTSSFCLNRTAYDQNLCTPKTERSLQYYISKLYINKNGKPMIYIIKSFTVSTSYFSYFFQIGHPLIEMFNKYLMILKENGFIQKIYADFDRSNSLVFMQIHRETFKYVPLTTVELQKVFLIYLIGALLSIVVFAFEYRYEVKFRRKHTFIL
ncbi:Ionotropic receptor 123, partial [Diabrotica virgifera virgifera]